MQQDAAEHLQGGRAAHRKTLVEKRRQPAQCRLRKGRWPTFRGRRRARGIGRHRNATTLYQSWSSQRRIGSIVGTQSGLARTARRAESLATIDSFWVFASRTRKYIQPSERKWGNSANCPGAMRVTSHFLPVTKSAMYTSEPPFSAYGAHA